MNDKVLPFIIKRMQLKPQELESQHETAVPSFAACWIHETKKLFQSLSASLSSCSLPSARHVSTDDNKLSLLSAEQLYATIYLWPESLINSFNKDTACRKFRGVHAWHVM